MTFYALQARIEKLRAHIRRAGKRGDRQALMRLVQLRQEAERHRVSSLKTGAFDLMLQELYADDTVLQAAMQPSPFFSKLVADERVPRDRAYVVPLTFPPGAIILDEPEKK